MAKSQPYLPAQSDPGASPAQMLATIQKLAPDIAARGDEAERERRPPDELAARLADTGVFRMLWARERGGLGFTIPEALPVIEALAAADGSAGWSTMIGVESASIWLRFGETIASARNATHGVMTRCALIPRGVARETTEGWRLQGRWPLTSGAYDADWFICAAQVLDGDAPRMRADGLPDMRYFAVAPERVEILDTWKALGLRSTMSHDIVIDTTLPPHHAAPALGTIDTPHALGRLPTWLALGPFHCAVILGIVSGALSDLTALLPTKRPVLNPVIRTSEDPLVQHQVGEAATRLNSARAFLMSEMNAAWAMAEANTEFTPQMRVRFRSMLTFVHAECIAVMDRLFHLAGATPVYDGSPLQRRFRDLRTACQHVTASTEVYRPYGAFLMDAPVPNAAAL